MGIPEEYRGVVAITLASLLVLGGSVAIFITTAGYTSTSKLEVVGASIRCSISPTRSAGTGSIC